MATAQATPKFELKEVDLDLIKVEEGFNPRTEFDPKELERLRETVESVGVTQTLSLRPTDDGHYTIVAGERRYWAAKEAGLQRVPAMVGDLTDGEAKRIAWIENHHRADLNPIEDALGLKAFAEEWELTTHKAIAEKAGISAPEVGSMLRLLDLPPGVQKLIASGDVPVAAEKKLREVAAISPRVAECVCEYAKRKEVGHTEFVRTFDDKMRATAAAKFNTDPPTMISTARPLLSVLVPDTKARRELLRRIEEATGLEYEDPALEFGEEEDDAARALGCLIEIEPKYQYSSPDTFITDRAVAADLAERYVERLERTTKEREERKAEEAAAKEAKGEDGKPAEDKEAAERKAAYAKRETDRESAVLFNEDLGINLIKHRGGKTRKQRSLARGKAMAKILLAQNGDLAASGLRLVISQLQKTEQKELKSGKLGKPKTVFAPKKDCIKFLERRIDEAKTADEANEVLAEAMIAGLLADERATTVADRVYWSLPYDVAPEVKKLLGPDIKEVRPRRRTPKKRK